MAGNDQQILVIDDDNVVRQSIVAYLEDSGFDVIEAASGNDGLEVILQQEPDVVITDLRMPEVDGLTILKTVREIKPHIPVIVVSGMGVVRDVIDALRLGAADYLVKPLVDMEMLIHAVDRAYENSRLREENVEYRSQLERANRELRESLRELERDQNAGRSVQIKLLPPTPVEIGGLCLSYRLIPSLYLSGDLIDYGLLEDRYLAFYLTDVSGHGSAPAFVTIWLRQLVRRYFREKKIFHDDESFRNDTANLLSLINAEVMSSELGCHMTCFVGVIDTHTREMRYVFGGHLPFPLLIVDNQAEYLMGKGKPVGIFENATWEVNTLQLPDEFSLVVFSDGILEVLPPEQLIEKEDYLKKAMQINYSVEDICRALNVDNLDSAPDDIAILKISSERLP